MLQYTFKGNFGRDLQVDVDEARSTTSILSSPGPPKSELYPVPTSNFVNPSKVKQMDEIIRK